MNSIPSYIVVAVALIYLSILFAVAHYADRRAQSGKSLINANIYSLSLAIFCTTWTFLGSVGMAATSGYLFLSIFIGPTITMFFSIVLLKILRIVKTYNVTSISDFISTRYEKSQTVAGMVTIIAIIGLIPYIALQLKAISLSFLALSTPHSWLNPTLEQLEFTQLKLSNIFSISDSALWITIFLAFFTIIFGVTSSDYKKRNEGVVVAIAFETVVKLVAFLAVGIFVVFFMFEGPQQLSQNAWKVTSGYTFFALPDDQANNWISFTILSALAIIVLPRQFQVMFIENVEEHHLSRAIWMFPLYLLLINLLVIPIALAGLIYFQNQDINPELFVLALPLVTDNNLLALLVFIGCLSAGTAMIIVESKALSLMICNDIIMPTILRLILPINYFKKYRNSDFSQLIIFIRRISIILILLIGYSYYRIIGNTYGLAGMGLISFIAVAQFAPAILGGIYWQGANKYGAISGLIGGFIIWFYTSMLPSFVRAGIFDYQIIEEGFFGISFLAINSLLGVSVYTDATHSFFWSITINITLFVGVSLLTRQSISENVLARQFVEIFRRQNRDQLGKEKIYGVVPRGVFSDIYNLLERFLGSRRASLLLREFANKQNKNSRPRKDKNEEKVKLSTILNQPLNNEILDFVETSLAGSIGQASAKVMIAGVLKSGDFRVADVVQMVDEATNIRRYSNVLEKKSLAMKKAGIQLQAEYSDLQKKGKLQEDYIATLSHELRTPLTSIRTYSELMLSIAELEISEREKFLKVVISESDRLSRMINQILDLAKIESGNQNWQNKDQPLLDIVEDSISAVYALYREKDVKLSLEEIEGDPIVSVDRDRLFQVMENLLANALKFSPSGNGEVFVRIKQVKNEDETTQMVKVIVEDNGLGINEGDHEKIFEKYHQSQNQHKEKQTRIGTGLGLPICRHIINNFGGEIWSENQSDKSGAVFIFTLPII